MKNIIVQAGGRGSRLESLTINKPKCLVSIENLPIIFHLFKKYENAKFQIIADYKSDVLEKFLKAFSSNIDYEIIVPLNKGTCSGIKDALRSIPENEPFMIIWCDLIISESLQLPENIADENYIGISRDFECRWSFLNGKCVKKPSKKDGIAGLFLFKNKDVLFDIIPEENAFVGWLSTTGIELTPFSLEGTKEIGTMLCYNQNVDTNFKCRPFNKIIFEDEIVKKWPVTDQGRLIAKHEVQWYKFITEKKYKYIPKIRRFEPLEMDRINGKNIFEFQNFTKEQKSAILKQIVKRLQNLHECSDKKESNKDDCIKNYFEKTFDRLEKVKGLVPFASEDIIKINGREYKNVFKFKSLILEKLNRHIPDEFCVIHGDPTFSNLILNPETIEIFLIDPRGYFGDSSIFGDKDYDFAKLYYSLIGNYDQFNNKNFNLEILKDDVLLNIKSNGWEALEEQFFEITSASKEKIKLLHALIWLSLTTYAWDDYDSICGAFYNGIIHLNEAIQTEPLVLSKLSKTWVIDVDGTMVKHNGYLNGEDVLLDGVRDFFNSISNDDIVILMTAREKKYQGDLEIFLSKNGIRYNELLTDMPHGERILINDMKNSGLKTAYAINKFRDSPFVIDVVIDDEL